MLILLKKYSMIAGKGDEKMEELKSRLIVAGIKEIQLHGLGDFSLRRVANACGASCAAPYKHFENKDGFILEILRFVNGQWELLEQQITLLYGDQPARLLEEVCVANIRFRLANPQFDAVMKLNAVDLDETQREALSRPFASIPALLKRCGEPVDTLQQKEYVLRSLIYGASQMISGGDLPNTEESIQMIRETVRRCIGGKG